MTDQVNEQPTHEQSAPEASGNSAPQAKPEAPKPAVVYEKTGDRAVDGALRILSRAGVAQDSFEMDAARRGEFAPLRAVLSHLGAEDGDIAIQLLESAYMQYQEQEARTKTELRKDLLDIAGGAKEWDATLEFIDANADPEESEELMAALEEGGTTAKMAARYMALLYQTYGKGEQPQPVEESFESPRTSGSPSKTGGSDYLSSSEFYQQYQTLLNQGARENDPRIIRLQQARLRSIKADGY